MISIVIGKPGSGKSYEVVRSLYERFENARNLGGALPHVVTNLRLNLPAWGKYAEYIEIVDDQFFHGEWWDQFQPGTLVILDEAQYYLSEKRLENVEITHLEEHFSTHRHLNLEYVLITQNLTSLSLGVRRYAQSVTQINNNKNVVIPFPVNIPTRDISILLRGFGIQRQSYYAVTADLLNSHKTDKDASSVFHTTNKFVYSLYSTNKTGANDDMPLPYKLGKGAWRRAISWFVYKHFFNIAIKLGVIIVFFAGTANIYFKAKNKLDKSHTKVVESDNTISDGTHNTADNLPPPSRVDDEKFFYVVGNGRTDGSYFPDPDYSFSRLPNGSRRSDF